MFRLRRSSCIFLNWSGILGAHFNEFAGVLEGKLGIADFIDVGYNDTPGGSLGFLDPKGIGNAWFWDNTGIDGS